VGDGESEQDNEYGRLIDTANAPIFGVDTAGNVTVWNKCAAAISGYSSRETIGRHLVQVYIMEDFRATVQEVFDKALRGEETANFQVFNAGLL
jgi:PAS domain S-box-containing protein